ncbi:hypothetical protein FA09DRAFT_83036 [Tilletiopsis washingtonensis]|uniref:G-patch domain-containing protein n=1 Tax=Tilletiopsis washingtonensis TaxID=58919 RepID=A0A316Z6M3_9BASI|nr:hypothetical protein FA09DRAFT_83036 [Tilletiopsis washingtonensis]PWN96704.1 hypothetical protein FA09DRAFT_83036 [Tilletiopsis washingtonensis]
MPMDTSQYMLAQGWAGAGVPLDGHGGNGLKKPLAIPQKRGMKGLGKDRDRAVEWWDCLFEAGAKTLAIADPSRPASASGTSTPEASSSTGAAAPPAAKGLSLVSLAKREHARRSLMSGFVRGRAHEAIAEELRKAEADLVRRVAEQDRRRREAREHEEEERSAARQALAAAAAVQPSSKALGKRKENGEALDAEKQAARKAARAARKAAKAAAGQGTAAARKAEARAERRARKQAKAAKAAAVPSQAPAETAPAASAQKRKRKDEPIALQDDAGDESKEERRARREAKRARKAVKATGAVASAA